MATPTLLGRAAIVGLLVGLLAAATAVLPPLAWGLADSRPAEYAALLVVLVGTHLGLAAVVRDRPSATFGARVWAAMIVAGTASLPLAVALYRLYAVWRPGMLLARYEALLAHVGAQVGSERVAAALADLTARRAAYLDPLYQAINGAGTPLFFALLIGGYSAFRWRVAQRLAAAAAARRSAR
ncbi:MAG: hypothetical protein WCH32_06860 [Pseudomonadota bacterium]